MMPNKIAHMLPANLVPDFLKERRGWLLWRYEDNGTSKPRKVPYYVSGGRRRGLQGAPADREHLATFDQVFAAYRAGKWSGIGFAMLPDWGLVGMDFDDCVVDGRVDPAVLGMIAGTYAEISPSGHGVRAFFTGDLVDRKSHSTADQYGIEVFCAKGFLTITGNVLPECLLVGVENEASPLPAAVRAVYAERFRGDDPAPTSVETQPMGLDAGQLRELLRALPSDLDYDAWLKVGMSLHHETSGTGFALWDEWSQASAKYTSADYGRERWQSFGRHGGRPVTIHSLISLARDHGALVGIKDFDDLTKALDPTRFQVLGAEQFAERPAPTWIVKRVLPKAGLAVVYGESGSGKSFFVLDLVLTIARGLAWREHRTHTARTVYICAEGIGGFRNRLVAYAAQHKVQLADLPMGIVADAPNLLIQDDLKVAEQIEAWGGADIIVVDTFAQATPGANENSADDMGKALGHCRRLHERTGALVLLVHHAGKDPTKGARGWSGIKAAADVEIEITRDGAQRCAKVSKLKDGEDGGEYHFMLAQVEVGRDEDGEATTSCVLEHCAPPVREAPERGGPKGDWETHVWRVLEDCMGVTFAPVLVDSLLDEAVRRAPKVEKDGRDRRRELARRALFAMATRGTLVVEDEMASIPMAELA